MLADIYLPETEFKRIRRSEVSGDLTHHLQVSAEQLSTLPQEKLDLLIDLMEQLQAVPVKDPPPLQLASGE